MSKIDRRDFIKMVTSAAGVLAAGRLGLNTIDRVYRESSFYKKLDTLKRLIDSNPDNDDLKDSFSAFIQGHMVITGAHLQGLHFPADNLWSYFYGEGKSVDITQKYQDMAKRISGSLENYLSEELTIGLNCERANSGPVKSKDDFVNKIGFMKGGRLPDFDELQVLISPDDGEIGFGMGRHTIRCALLTAQQFDLNPVDVKGKLKELVDLIPPEEKVSIKRYSVVAYGPIKVYDKYYFNRGADMSAAGFEQTSEEVRQVLAALTKLVDIQSVAKYMGEDRFKKMTEEGFINIDQKGLAKLEELGLAKSFEMKGSLQGVGKFSIDVILRK